MSSTQFRFTPLVIAPSPRSTSRGQGVTLKVTKILKKTYAEIRLGTDVQEATGLKAGAQVQLCWDEGNRALLVVENSNADVYPRALRPASKTSRTLVVRWPVESLPFLPAGESARQLVIAQKRQGRVVVLIPEK